MYHDVSQLNNEFKRIASTLSSIESRFANFEQQAQPKAVNAATPLQRAKEYYHKRRIRERMFGNMNLFSDPAWDILIDLYIATEEGRQISVSSACVASAASTTTALRCLKTLEKAGHVVRKEDPTDARRVFMSLTDSAIKTVRKFFSD